MIKNNRREDYPWNQKEDDLNCASYALNCNFWYEPDRSYTMSNADLIESLLWSEYTEDSMAKMITNRSVAQIKKDFENEIRVLNSEKDLLKDEELIAFKVGVELNGDDYDYDFHFRVLRNNIWMEKLGSGEIAPAKDNTMLDDWFISSIIYNGPLVLFAHKLI